MENIPSLCLRCPPSEAELWLSTSDNPETLTNCNSPNHINELWTSFPKKSNSDPPALLHNTDKCQYFIVDVYKENETAIAALEEQRKANTEVSLKQLADIQSQLPASDGERVSVPVNKQTLEYAFRRRIAKISAG